MTEPIAHERGAAATRFPRTFIVAVCALTVVLVVGLWRQMPRLNGPHEWQWSYQPPSLGLLPGIVALVAAAALLLLSFRRRGVGPWSALIAAAAVLPFGVMAAIPGGVDQVMEGLASRDTFGFVWDAGLAPDTAALLADYPAASAGLNQHSVTHPPGPLLVVRGVDAVVRATPDSDDFGAGNSLRAAAVRALALERSRARAHGRPLPTRLPRAGTLVLLALALPLCGGLAAIPLAALARSVGLEPHTAFLAAVLWSAVPARSLFSPSFDQALPLLLITAAWLAVRREWWAALAAGALLWCAVLVSYGCLTFAPLLVLLSIMPRGEAGEQPVTAWRTWRFGRAVLVLSTAGLLAAAFWWWTGFEPFRAMRTALALHHRIAVEPRSYALWLLGNPYDFGLLVGPPLLACGVFGPWYRRVGQTGKLGLLGWGVWGLLAVLWISGNVRGEVGRIWLPWMPLLCILAAPVVEASGRSGRALVVATELALLGTLAANLAFMA